MKGVCRMGFGLGVYASGEKGTRCETATAPATVSGECDRHMPLRPIWATGRPDQTVTRKSGDLPR